MELEFDTHNFRFPSKLPRPSFRFTRLRKATCDDLIRFAAHLLNRSSSKFYLYRRESQTWSVKTKSLRLLPSLSQVWSASQKPKTRGIIVRALLTPRWLVFLFPVPAEGRPTSGAAVGKKTKKLSILGRCRP